MAVSNVSLFGAAFLTPVVVGKVTKSLGWQWSFYLVAIFLGASFPLTFFFVPETAFRRPDHLNTDFKHQDGQGESTSISGASNDETKELRPENRNELGGTSRTEVPAPIPEKNSFVKISSAVQWPKDRRELLQIATSSIAAVLPSGDLLGKYTSPGSCAQALTDNRPA
jgi:MFS family permease